MASVLGPWWSMHINNPNYFLFKRLRRFHLLQITFLNFDVSWSVFFIAFSQLQYQCLILRCQTFIMQLLKFECIKSLMSDFSWLDVSQQLVSKVDSGRQKNKTSWKFSKFHKSLNRKSYASKVVHNSYISILL